MAVTDAEMSLLRDAYARGDLTMRDVIRETAALSLDSERIPTRRYTP